MKKIRPVLVFLTVACMGLVALPVFAQAVNPKAEATLQQFMATHPEVRANPGLMSDPTYLSQHSALRTFLQQHPNVRNQTWAMGAYDRNHQWQNSQWWFKNDPNWVRQHHPQWAQSNPQWYNDGDWDDQNRWHDRDWWTTHDRQWAEQHHPGWYEHQGKHPHGHAYGHNKGHHQDNGDD
jgi:hypothetical protein